MSDMPNGQPKGQNNLDAGTPAYVDPKNDPSAGAQKSDQERPKSDGVDTSPVEVDPDVEAELKEASTNYVDPAVAEKPAAKTEAKK